MKYFLCFCAALLLATTFASAQIIPDGGERWTTGQLQHIQWPAGHFPNGTVDISLWDGNNTKWHHVATCAVEAGNYNWKVPKGLSGDLFRMKITSTGNPAIALMSGSYFFISEGTNGGPGVVLPDSVRGVVRLAPNPASELVAAAWEGEAVELRIWDIPGRSVLFLPLSGESTTSFSIAGILPGMYIVEVRLRNGRLAHGRLIVSR